MSAERPRFPIAVWCYLVSFFLLLGFLPVCLAATTGHTAAPAFWVAALMWPFVLALLAVYAQRRCSSGGMGYTDGLLWITGSMMTGWVYLSFFLTIPVLLMAYSASIFFAVFGDLRRSRGYSQAKWYMLVHYFYRNRMKQ